MALKVKKLCLLIYIFYVVSKSYGLVESQKTNISDNVLLHKILQTIDAANSDAYLFDVTLKLLQSVCACMHETLYKKLKVIIDQDNSLNLDDKKEQENDINLYKQLYNNTCINLRHEIVNKIRKHGSDNNDDTYQQTNNAISKYENHNLDENIKTVIKRTIFTTLIKTRENRIYKIAKHNLFKNTVLLGDNNESRIIIIITLYPFSNQTLNEIEKTEVTENEINETLLKKTPIDIDIINTVNMLENKKNYKVVTAKKCDLYSIYLFIVQSLERNKIKTFRFLRRKGTIKIYIDASINQIYKDFPNPCCKNYTLLTECTQNIFSVYHATENFVPNRTEKSKSESYKDIVSKIKLLLKEYNKKIEHKNQLLIRSNKHLLATNPSNNFGYITEYNKYNKSQRILNKPETPYTVIPNSDNLQVPNTKGLITPTSIMTTPFDEYILSNKKGSLADSSESNNSHMATNEASSSIIPTILSGIILENLFTNIEVPPTETHGNLLNMRNNNSFTHYKLLKNVITALPHSTPAPINLVLYSKWPESWSTLEKDVTTTLKYPHTSITFKNIPKSISINTQQYINRRSSLKTVLKQIKEVGKSTIPMDNGIKNSSRKVKSLSSVVLITESPDMQHISRIINKNTTKESLKLRQKTTELILRQNNNSQRNVIENLTQNPNNFRFQTSSTNSNMSLLTSSLQNDNLKSSKEATKTYTLVIDKSSIFQRNRNSYQPHTLSETKYLHENQNKLHIILDQNKEISTSVHNTFAFDRNKTTYVSNTNKNIRQLKTGPDNYANIAHLKKLGRNLISKQKNIYEETSPLYIIKYKGKKRNTKYDNEKSTPWNISNKPNASGSNFEMLFTLPETLPFQAVTHLKSNLFPLAKLKNTSLYGQNIFQPQKTLNLKSLLKKKKYINQKNLDNLPFYESNVGNFFSNFIESSFSRYYLTSNTTLNIDTLNIKVKDFKRQSEFLTSPIRNTAKSSVNSTFSSHIDIPSNDSHNYFYGTETPHKFKSLNWINESIEKNTQPYLIHLIPNLPTVFGKDIHNNATTSYRNNDKNVVHENDLSTSKLVSFNKYIRYKNGIRQINISTTASGISEIKYFNKNFKTTLERPLLRENMSGVKKIKLDGIVLSDNKISVKPESVIGSPSFAITKSIRGKGTTEFGAYNTNSFINKKDDISPLPSLMVKKGRPQFVTTIKNISRLSIWRKEDIIKLKTNVSLSGMNGTELVKSITPDTENSNTKPLDTTTYENKNGWKELKYLVQKHITNPILKDVSENPDFLKNISKLYNTKIQEHTTEVSIGRSQNGLIIKNNKNENKKSHNNNILLYLNENQHKNKSNITSKTIPITTTKETIKFISNNKIKVTKITTSHETLFKRNASYTSANNNQRMSTVSAVLYAPNIVQNKLSELHPTKYSKFNNSQKEIDKKIKSVISTGDGRETKKSILLSTLFNIGITQNLGKDIMILDRDNTNKYIYFNSTKQLLKPKVTPNNKNTETKRLIISTEPEVIVGDIKHNMKLNKSYQNNSKKNNSTEYTVATQSIKNVTYLKTIKEQNLTKKDTYLTMSLKKPKKRSTKTMLEEDVKNTSSIISQIKLISAESDSTVNFTKQIKIKTTESFISRNDNDNGIGSDYRTINITPEIKVRSTTIKTNNISTLHPIHKDSTLMHHTRSYTNNLKNTNTKQNVSTIRTVNLVTVNKQKYLDTSLQKGEEDNYLRKDSANLKEQIQRETLDKPISDRSTISIFMSQIITPETKDRRQMADNKSGTIKVIDQTVKDTHKTMKLSTINNQNYRIKYVPIDTTKDSKQYASNKTNKIITKSTTHKNYLTTSTNLIQNNAISEKYLNTDLKRTIDSTKVYINLEKNYSFTKQNIRNYTTDISAVIKKPTVENRFIIYNVKSTIPVLLNTHTSNTYPRSANYLQNKSDYPKTNNLKITKDLFNNMRRDHKHLYHKTDLTNIELQLAKYNRNITTAVDVLNNNITNTTENEVVQKEIQSALNTKELYRDKKTFVPWHSKFPSEIKFITKPYSKINLHKYRRSNPNNNMQKNENNVSKYRHTRSFETDLLYNNKSDNGVSGSPAVQSRFNNNNKNKINDTTYPSSTNGKNKNYDFVSLSFQDKSSSYIKENNFNNSVLPTTSKNIINNKNISSGYKDEAGSSKPYKMNWNIKINKPFSINPPEILSSNRNNGKEENFEKSKSSATSITDSSLNKLKTLERNNNQIYNTSKSTHLSLSFVPYVKSENSIQTTFLQETANEYHSTAIVPLDRNSEKVDQNYTALFPLTSRTLHPVLTETQLQILISKINSSKSPTYDKYNVQNKYPFIIHYENLTNNISNFDIKASGKQNSLRTKVLHPKQDKANESKSNISVINKTANNSYVFSNISIFCNGSDCTYPHNVKVQINNNLKFKSLMYQKVYIKNNYKSLTTMRLSKKRKIIKYNTYKPTEGDHDVHDHDGTRVPIKNKLLQSDKQTNKPKISYLLSTKQDIIDLPTKSIRSTQFKLRKDSVVTNPSGTRPTSTVSNVNLIKINRNSLYSLKKTNLYPIKKLPSTIQKKVWRRIHFPIKGNEIATMNTDVFFRRRATPNNNYISNHNQPYSKYQIEKPVTFKPKQYIIRPNFDQIDGFSLKGKYFRPKPLLIDNNDFYRAEMYNHHRSNSLLLRQKVNYIRDTLPPPIEKSKVSHVIERPAYLPPNTKPKFLRDRIDSIRNYVNNGNFFRNTEFLFKHNVEATTEVAGVPYQDPIYYFRRSGWFDSRISDDLTTSTMVSKRTRRQRKTIFFLSPSVPYRYF